ncbi:extracellular solute-binding protein [Virgibacillus siamensis]|uniref:extracellular solute-binding protein n=1 Tax=Virgibacillus siamensis TaxID=480071 RepID=UPI001FEC209B|nr:extracellular solute-binding protein [Virgibacillus siamensis]
MKWIKRKTIVMLVVILVPLALLAACSGSADGEDSGENVLEIVYRTPDEQATNWLESVKKEFEKKHKDVSVKLSTITGSEGNYPSKKVLMMKSEETAPDIIQEDSYQVKADAEAGYLQPISDRVNKWNDWNKFYDSVKSGVTGSDGKIYGVPFSTDVRGLWYNKKVFEKVGIPTPWKPESWEDVINAAKKLKGEVEVPFWLNSGKAMGEATTMQSFLMLLTGTGSKLYHEDSGKWVIESDGFVDSLQFFDTIYEEDLGPSLSWGITGQAGTKIAQQLMPKGEVGIALDGNWMSGNWVEDGAVPWPEWSETYGFTAMPTQNGQEPGKTTVSGGWTLAIPAKADKKDLAWKFIKLATSKENLRYGTQLTPRKDIAKLDEYLKITYQDKMTDLLEYTHFRPSYSTYPTISTNIQAAVEAVTTDSMTPEEAMERFAKDVKRDAGSENVTKE